MTPKHYAAVGTDGTRPVVWGIGDTHGLARSDARQWLGKDLLDEPLVVVEITAEQRQRIEDGEVSTEALGIQLSADGLRELGAQP